MKIAIMESLGITNEELSELKKPFEARGNIFIQYEKTTDIEKLIEETKGIDIMILANMPMPKEVLEKCDKLKFINVAFTGVDHIDMGIVKEKGIAVSNASGYSNEAVAELVIGMTISKLRNIKEVERKLYEGKTKDGLIGSEIKGKTVGIIGLGKIGTRTAELFNVFGAKIKTYNRSIHKNVADYIKQVSLEELLKTSDIVVLHCPLTEETKNLINMEKLKLMKKSSILINVARGPVVNKQDLVTALEEGIISGACLDVFDEEPPLRRTDIILNAPNTLLTPHIAFATKESMYLRAQIIFKNLEAWLNGKQENIVN